jgi:hypothetical protein
MRRTMLVTSVSFVNEVAIETEKYPHNWFHFLMRLKSENHAQGWFHFLISLKLAKTMVANFGRQFCVTIIPLNVLDFEILLYLWKEIPSHENTL